VLCLGSAKTHMLILKTIWNFEESRKPILYKNKVSGFKASQFENTLQNYSKDG
jgi:hypothetical protein